MLFSFRRKNKGDIDNGEAYIPAEQSQTKEDARFPREDEKKRRTACSEAPPPERKEKAGGIEARS
jgi:hypothetical protein